MKKNTFRFRTAAVAVVFFALSFLLWASKTGENRLYLLSAAVPGALLFFFLFPAVLFPTDRVSLTTGLMLAAFGILAFASHSPDLSVTQALRCVSSLPLFLLGAVLIRAFRLTAAGVSVSAILSILLLSLPFLDKSLPAFQESGLYLLLFSVSGLLALRRKFPALLLSLAGLFMLLFQDSSVFALLCGCVSVLLFWVYSESGLWSVLASLCHPGALLCCHLLIKPALTPAAAQLSGWTPFPLLMPETPPNAAELSSSVFISIGQQYGVILLLCIVFLLMILLIRGSSLALHARSSFHSALALSGTLLLGLHSLYYLLALHGFLPVQDLSFPFLTDSIPDLLADFFLLGIFSGISFRNEADLEEDTRLSMLAR